VRVHPQGEINVKGRIKSNKNQVKDMRHGK